MTMPRYRLFLEKLLATIPYSVEAYLMFCDALHIPPRYDASWRHLNEWLHELENSSEGTSPALEQRVLFFSADQFWTNYTCAMAILLAGRKIPVDIAWVFRDAPSSHEPYKSFQHFQKLSVDAVKRCSHPLISLHNLSSVTPADAEDEMIRIAEQQAEIDASYLLQKERIDISRHRQDAIIFDERFKNNLDAIRRMAAFLKTRQYARMIMPSGGILEHGAVYRYANARGIPISTIETCDVNGKMWASNDGPVVAINTSALWTQDEPHVLSEQRQIRVNRILETRQSPASKELVIEYQHTDPATPPHILAQLGLRDDRPVILMCPNVPFDAIFYMGGKHIFAGMWEWLIKTIQFFKERNDCQVVIRCHPAEPHYRTEETTQKLIAEHFDTLPDHIVVVPPRGAINTYSLMQIADMGIVYASTTGLEMAMRGIPVICGNPVQHYNAKGFTIDPLKSDDYYRHIDRILTDPRSARLTDRQIELAWCYADLYFNKWYLPFPWHVLSLWKDMKAWPIRRMLSDEGQQRYGDFLDRLIGEII